MKFFLIAVVGIVFLSACGRDKGYAYQSGSNLCSQQFVDDYNKLQKDVNTIASRVANSKEKLLAEVEKAQTRNQRYAIAKAAVERAISESNSIILLNQDFKNKYAGVKCSGKSTTKGSYAGGTYTLPNYSYTPDRYVDVDSEIDKDIAESVSAKKILEDALKELEK